MPIYLLTFLAIFGSLLALRAAPPERSKVVYFRSDGGVAGQDAGPLPESFEANDSLRWRVPVDAGQSTPIISGGKIFLTTCSTESKALATLALDRETGKAIWTQLIPATRIEAFHPQSGTAAPATPVCDGERLYVFFGSYGLICYDLNGKQLWENRLGPFPDEYGAGSSPILLDGKIILNQDHDVDSFLIAIDAMTGKTVWKTPRPDAVRSYATPAVWSRNGHSELLVAGALELAAYDPGDGKKLWWTHGLARIVIPTPVPDGERIYMASWSPGGDAQSRISFDPWPVALEKWDQNKDGKLAKEEIKDANVLDRFVRMDLDQNGYLNEAEWTRQADVFRRAKNALLALKPSSDRGELKESDLLWSYPKGVPYVATPLLEKGVLWMVKDGGIVTRIDTATGQKLSEERLNAPGSYFASPVAGEGKVYFCSDHGVVTVAAGLDSGWRIFSTHDFHEAIHATPLIEQDRIYIRTAKALYCFQGRKT